MDVVQPLRITALILQMIPSEVFGYTPVSPPFKNICALTSEKIEGLIVCTQDLIRQDGKPKIAEEFDLLVQQFGTLTRADVIKMACRSVGDDGSIMIAEYIDSARAYASEEYIVTFLKTCGYID